MNNLELNRGNLLENWTLKILKISKIIESLWLHESQLWIFEYGLLQKFDELFKFLNNWDDHWIILNKNAFWVYFRNLIINNNLQLNLKSIFDLLKKLLTTYVFKNWDSTSLDKDSILKLFLIEILFILMVFKFIITIKINQDKKIEISNFNIEKFLKYFKWNENIIDNMYVFFYWLFTYLNLSEYNLRGYIFLANIKNTIKDENIWYINEFIRIFSWLILSWENHFENLLETSKFLTDFIKFYVLNSWKVEWLIEWTNIQLKDLKWYFDILLENQWIPLYLPDWLNFDKDENVFYFNWIKISNIKKNIASKIVKLQQKLDKDEKFNLHIKNFWILKKKDWQLFIEIYYFIIPYWEDVHEKLMWNFLIDNDILVLNPKELLDFLESITQKSKKLHVNRSKKIKNFEIWILRDWKFNVSKIFYSKFVPNTQHSLQEILDFMDKILWLEESTIMEFFWYWNDSKIDTVSIDEWETNESELTKNNYGIFLKWILLNFWINAIIWECWLESILWEVETDKKRLNARKIIEKKDDTKQNYLQIIQRLFQLLKEKNLLYIKNIFVSENQKFIVVIIKWKTIIVPFKISSSIYIFQTEIDFWKDDFKSIDEIEKKYWNCIKIKDKYSEKLWQDMLLFNLWFYWNETYSWYVRKLLNEYLTQHNILIQSLKLSQIIKLINNINQCIEQWNFDDKKNKININSIWTLLDILWWDLYLDHYRWFSLYVWIYLESLLIWDFELAKNIEQEIKQQHNNRPKVIEFLEKYKIWELQITKDDIVNWNTLDVRKKLWIPYWITWYTSLVIALWADPNEWMDVDTIIELFERLKLK